MGAWLTGRLTATSLFSLRLPTATSTAAKTCLIPAPYSLKLALVDALIHADGLEVGMALFELLRRVEVRVRPPERLVVTNTLIKVASPYESKVKAEERAEAERKAAADDGIPFKSTIAFREFIHYGGPLEVSWNADDLDDAERQTIQRAWLAIRYVGKRGSTFQPAPLVVGLEAPGNGYSFPADPPPMPCPIPFLVQFLDDLGAEAQWDRVNTFSTQPLRMGKERIRRAVALPLRIGRKSRSFTEYVRVT